MILYAGAGTGWRWRPGNRMSVSRPTRTLSRFALDERGATAIEYALIAAILGIALIPVLASTSSGVAGLYTKVQDYFDMV